MTPLSLQGADSEFLERINAISEQHLIAIGGVSVDMAQKIVRARGDGFTSTDQLKDKVTGLGAKKVENLKV